MSPAEPAPRADAWFASARALGAPADHATGSVTGSLPTLICFHHAGGTATVYRGWQEALEGVAEVRPLQLPGRGLRLREEPYTRAGPLVTDITDVLAAAGVGAGYALFGHSMGALLAYEVACALRTRGLPEPRHLFVSASRAPHLYGERSDHTLTDEGLRGLVTDLGGLGEDDTVGAAYLRRRLPVLRADLTVCDTYRWLPRAPLGCPMTAFSPAGDPIAPPRAVEAWRACTSGSFLRRPVEAGHFYLTEEPHRSRLLRDVRAEMSRPQHRETTARPALT